MTTRIAVLGALLVTGCGAGVEAQSSPLASMDIVGVWTKVFRLDEPPSLFPTNEPMHHHDAGVAYITPQVTTDEVAHVLTHVWIARDALRLTPEQHADAPGAAAGDPEHRAVVWAANQPADDVLERAAARYLRENATRDE